MRAALTIAGSDCSGGAGIQADIKAMTMNGVFAMSAVTALTAQNTAGIRSIQQVSPQFLADQLDMVFEESFPDAVKIGMVGSRGLIEVIAEKLDEYGAKNIVVDPVMTATSGRSLVHLGDSSALAEKLFTRAVLVTPNIPEAEHFSGMKVITEEDMIKAAEVIGSRYGCGVLVKGGHMIGKSTSDDLLYIGGRSVWFRGRRIDSPHTHGTGCTLSSAIAANLAKGYSLETAVEAGKKYLAGALAAGIGLKNGIDHGFELRV